MTESKTNFWRATRWSGLIVREVIGWVLLLCGLYTFWTSMQYLNDALVVQGFVSAIIGVILFRGGLQLVKVAVAARAFRNDGPQRPEVAGYRSS